MNCYIIAEAGVNHNGSEEMALQLVDAAADAGADAVKFQTFKAATLVQEGAAKAEYQKKQTGDGDQYAMLKSLELSDEAHVRLAIYCKERSIEFLSTGFDEVSIDMLLKLGMKRLKIPSGELTNKPYIEYVASKNLPVILSTGMGTLDEVQEAIEWIKSYRDKMGYSEALAEILTILHCTSNYPAPLASVNLRAMHTMAKEFGLPVGYSDHTAGILISPIAVAMGASVIEKHFTLDNQLDGPDHQASLEPDELKNMVDAIRDVEVSLGNGIKEPTASELEVRQVARRSIVLARDVQQDEILQKEDLMLLRPALGIPPKELSNIIGKKALIDLKLGSLLDRADISS